MANLQILIFLTVFLISINCKGPETKTLLKSSFFRNRRIFAPRPPAAKVDAQANLTPEQQWNKLIPYVEAKFDAKPVKCPANTICLLTCNIMLDRNNIPEYKVHFMADDKELGNYTVKQSLPKTEFMANEANLLALKHTVLEMEESPEVRAFSLYYKVQSNNVKEYSCRFEMPDKKHPLSIDSSPVKVPED